MNGSPAPAGGSGTRPSLRVPCTCRRVLAVPAERVGRTVQCPACGATVQVPDRAAAALPLEAGADLSGASCSICLGALAGTDGAVRCPACAVPYHGDCWAENGGCGAFGCALAPETVKEEEEGPLQTAWGDSKSCPACGREIQAVAIKCRHCKADFGTRDPITPREWHARRRGGAPGRRGLAITAFFLSASCLAMPAGAGIALYFLLSPARRGALADTDRILFLGAAGIGALYLLLLALVKVVGW